MSMGNRIGLVTMTSLSLHFSTNMNCRRGSLNIRSRVIEEVENEATNTGTLYPMTYIQSRHLWAPTSVLHSLSLSEHIYFLVQSYHSQSIQQQTIQQA